MLVASESLSGERLETLADLEALRPEWQHLWHRCPIATPFQSPEWIIPWWRHYGEGELFAFALRQAGRLVAVAPVYVYSDSADPTRRVFLLGTGNSDYLDLLAEENRAEAAVAFVLAQLARHRQAWDVCDFQQLPPGSALLEASLPAGWRDERRIEEWCPVLSLRRADEKPPEMWRQARYSRRRAAKSG
jgi:CelD/BcsL family acetyltransferase involved in cellulose biosynthesis